MVSMAVVAALGALVGISNLAMAFSWSHSSFTAVRKQTSSRMFCRPTTSLRSSSRLIRLQPPSVRAFSLAMVTNGSDDANGEAPTTPPAPRAPRTTQSLPPIPPNAHRLVLMRHGESEFNNANIFTGWCDVALTQRGVVEAVEAGQVFRSHELSFRKCYCSLLTRSIVTAHRSLEAAGVSYTPIEYDWRLNERHYGALQGLSKERTAVRLGRERVMGWRRSFDARPPLMTPEHPHYAIINNDARYRHLEGRLPLGESLEDCQARVVESYNAVLQDISSQDAKDNNDDSAASDESDYSLMVAHANTLRALVMHLDNIPGQGIEGLNIPTAIPFYYDIDKTTGRVVSDSQKDGQVGAGTLGVGEFRGIYIADERKKRSFLERRRAANDPWLWALHDHEVSEKMLVLDDEDESSTGLAGLEEEAKHNTQVFSSAMGNDDEQYKQGYRTR